MKYLPFILGGLVLGFVLGGIGPRSELSALEAERDALQEKLEDALTRSRPRMGGFSLPGVSEAFGGSGAAPSTPRSDRRGPDGEAEELRIEGEDGAPIPPEDIAESFDAAVEAQRLRSNQSRQALREQAGFNDGDMQQLDRIVADMNDELKGLGDEVISIVMSGEEPAAIDMLGITHDVTGVLYESQAELEALVGEDIEDVDSSAAEVWNYVDLEAFRDAVEDLEQ